MVLGRQPTHLARLRLDPRTYPVDTEEREVRSDLAFASAGRSGPTKLRTPRGGRRGTASCPSTTRARAFAARRALERGGVGGGVVETAVRGRRTADQLTAIIERATVEPQKGGVRR